MTREFLLFGLLLLHSHVQAENLLEAIKKWPDLSKAAALIEEDRVLPQLMKTMSYTAFIPTNDAMDKYHGEKNGQLIHYHLANIAYKMQDLPDEINTQLSGNPRLYVKRIPSGKAAVTGWEDNDFYINNAKVIAANRPAKTEDGIEQFFHTVDRVIEPTIAKTVADGSVPAAYLNPDAQKLLERPNLYSLVDDLSVEDFKRRVNDLNLMETFAMKGKNTFFIPTNQALNRLHPDQDLIDKQVIHGHIVPKEVLFTRTVESNANHSMSLAFTDNLKVLISMETVPGTTEEENTYYVKSNTVAGDGSHEKGNVIARIVRGNIPVKNGVVHLIDRPLMVVATNIISYLQEDKGQLSLFHQLIREHYEDLTHRLVVGQDFTLFAPSNEAFNMVNKEKLNEIKMRKESVVKLLNLHIINRRLTTDIIIEQSMKEIFQMETRSNGRKLYFAVNQMPGMEPSISLEGGGVNASVTTADIAAKNGVIHIIDRILGIPSQTVYEKLATDPMLSATFNLSEQAGWNERLKLRDEEFTLFVPSNDAWDHIRRTLPSAFKKLFMGEFSYHVRYILERHMIVGEHLNLERLAAMTTNHTERPGSTIGPDKRLQMTRGKIYFQARVKPRAGDATTQETTENGATEYYIEWNGISARVLRPDVECVNGVVHVVDKVLMMNRDVTVSGSTTPAVTGLAALLSTIITVAFARALHH